MGDRSMVVVSIKAKKGAKYHLKSCTMAVRIAEPRKLTIGTAKKEGFAACGTCKPE